MENQDSAVPHRRHTDSPSGALSPKEVLRQSETRFHLLVESVQDYAIYMLDPEGYVVSWNAGARRILGYTDAEILGQHFSVFYVPQDRAQEAPQQGLQAAAAEGRYEAEGRRMRKNGSHTHQPKPARAGSQSNWEVLGFVLRRLRRHPAANAR